MRFQDLQRRTDVLQAPLDDDRLRDLCQRTLGPAAQLLQHEHVRSGRFNTTHRLHFADRPPLILRLAPPPGADLFRHEAGLLQRECAIQPLLAKLGPVFPRVVAADHGCSWLPRPYVLQNCLDGELWSEVAPGLSVEDTASLWRQFGYYVRRIHGIAGPGYGFPAGPARHPGYSAWLEHLAADLTLDLADRGLSVDGLPAFRELLARGRALTDQADPPRLVHGDLWPRNILVTRHAGEWLISGILDAERAFWGEPAAEWIFAFLDIPEDFWRTYGRSFTPAALDRAARFRRHCYQARGALQLILEGARHAFDTGFARRDFIASLAGMEDMLRGPIHRSIAGASS